MKEGRKLEYPEQTPGDELQKMRHTKARKFKPQARLKPTQEHWWQVRKADMLTVIPHLAPFHCFHSFVGTLSPLSLITYCVTHTHHKSVTDLNTVNTSPGLPVQGLDTKILPAIVEKPHLNTNLMFLLCSYTALCDEFIAIPQYCSNAVLMLGKLQHELLKHVITGVVCLVILFCFAFFVVVCLSVCFDDPYRFSSSCDHTNKSKEIKLA